jgi:hypothetical protein
MTKKLVVRENRAVYLVDTETGEEQPMALVPQDEYQAFLTWREAQEHVRQRQDGPDAFEREREAFERLKADLLRTHRGQWVAVFQEQVVGVGDDQMTVLDNVYRHFGYVPVHVQRVEEQPGRFKFPHRKMLN